MDCKTNIYLNGINLYKEKEILFYEFVDNKVLFLVSNKKFIVEEDLIKGRKLISDSMAGKTQYNIVSKCSYCSYCKEEDKHINIIDCHKQIYNDAIELKKITNETINLFINPSVKNLAIKLFFDFNKDLYKIISPVKSELEVNFLEDSVLGAIQYKKEYSGKVYTYDINSFYPFVLSQLNIKIPVKEGKFYKLNDDDIDYNNISIGIYKGSISNFKPGIFKQNKNDTYTHTDILEAHKLGFKFKLNMDEEYNALIYDNKDCINSSDIFNEYVTYLYDLKKKNIKQKYIIKDLLNILFGALVESDKVVKKIKSDEEFIIYDNKDFKIEPMNSGGYEVTLYNKSFFYKGALPRMKPFLYSSSRKHFTKILNPIINNIVYVHTDSLYSKIPLDDYLSISDNIGDFKYEGEKFVNIKLT